MGLSGISIWSLLLIALIIMLLFGTKRVRDAGGDFGAAIKGLRKGLSSDDEEKIKKSLKKRVKIS